MRKLYKTSFVLITVATLTACTPKPIPEASIPAATGVQQYTQQPVISPTVRIQKPLPIAQPLQRVTIQQHRQQRNITQQRPTPPRSTRPSSSNNELEAIGQKIFVNEAGGDKRKLVHWNIGEDFAAMGIGHWTWYPAGRSRHRFGNSFPGLLSFMETKGVQLPSWLQQAKTSGAPWQNRQQLIMAKNTPQALELENLLDKTKDIQAQYIINRAKRAMPKLIKASPNTLQPQVVQNLEAVANTPGGWYALVDYVNFKGEGLNRHGGYQGQNWGLLQVLENMEPSRPGQGALNNFATSAMQVLERRVRNSPPARGEARWLAGWSNRISTYRRPI